MGIHCVPDAVFNGRRLRLLTFIGLFIRECRRIVGGLSLQGQFVQKALTAIGCFRDNPDVLKTKNGSEFADKVMDRRACDREIEICFTLSGNLTENPRGRLLMCDTVRRA